MFEGNFWRRWEHNPFACFIDYEKGFDTAQYGKFLKILRKQNVDERDLRKIANLYWHQKSQITVDGDVSNDISQARSIARLRAITSLVNVYSETHLSRNVI